MKIRKSTVDELIGYTRKLWNDPDGNSVISSRIDRAEELCKKEPVDWSPLLYLLDALFMYEGFAKDAGNDVVYAVIRLLGWEITNE